MSSAGREAGVQGRGPFSWRRAALHGLVPVGLAVVVGAALAATGQVADPRRFGQGLGRFVLFLWLVGAAISWLAQTGRRTAAWVVGLLLGGLVAASVAVALTGGPRGAPEPLTVRERAPLVRSADAAGAELSHPVVRFALRDPGPRFQPLSGELAVEVAGRLANQAEQHAWAYAAGPGEALVVLLAKGASERADFAALTAGFRAGLVDQLGGHVLRDEIVWDDPRHEWWFEGETPSQGFVALRMLGRVPGPDGAEFAVGALSITRQRGALDAVLESLRIR